MQEHPVGRVTHFFSKISVAVIAVTEKVKSGDTIHIKGAHSDFEQKIDSMQIEHKVVPEAKTGQSIGLKMKGRVHEGDMVYRLAE
jgi:hypothetical protein